MSARFIDSRAPVPPRTPGPARHDMPGPNPAQAQLRLRANRAAGTTLLAQQPASTWENGHSASRLSDDDVQLLQTLHARLTALRPPLAGRLDDIVDLFTSQKLVEHELKAVLIHHPHAPELTRLRHSLSLFIGHLCAAMHTTSASSRIDPASLTQTQVRALCQGLSTCVPSGAGLLFDPDLLRQDKTSLQGLTDGMQASGEVLDILNWVSRGLKAGLLHASGAIDRCFEKSLVLMAAWTGGDQCRQLLSDHNGAGPAGRCDRRSARWRSDRRG